MSEPINVGDWVMVVKACCEKHVRSPVFKVVAINAIDTNDWACHFCHKPLPKEADAEDDHTFCYPLSWLKRIPPLSELEGERTQEKLKEPA